MYACMYEFSDLRSDISVDNVLICLCWIHVDLEVQHQVN
jgi:hypothetical protein